MKYIFLLNSFGSRDITPIYKRIDIICKELKINYKIEVNSKDISTEDILRKYQDSQNIIIAVGGDGLINKVVNGVAGTNNILGYLPFGTGNDFHKSVSETLSEGINEIDLIKINDKYFVNNACFGIDADIANDDKIIHNKFIPSSQRYNVSVIYHFLKYKARDLRIIVNDEIINNLYTTVVVANGRYYGGKYKIGTNALLNDGMVDLYLIDAMPKIVMANLILGMEKGKHEHSKYVRKILTDKIKIESDKLLACNIDGEILTSNTFDISIKEKGIKLYHNKQLVKKVIEEK